MMLGRTTLFTLFMILACMPSASDIAVYGAVFLLGIHLIMALIPNERKTRNV